MPRTRNRKPTTPGEVLAEEFLGPAGLTQGEFARHLGVDVKTINRLVNGHTSLTLSLARRIGAAVNTSTEFWLNLQRAVDVYDAEQESPELPAPLPQFQQVG